MVKLYALLISCFFCITIFAQNIKRVESKESLYLEFYRGAKLVGSSTGFIVKKGNGNYLVTNYHMVTNKPAISYFSKKEKKEKYRWGSAPKGTAPTMVSIYHNSKENGKTLVKQEKLYDKQGRKRWYENRVDNVNVDVVSLPLNDTSDIVIYPVFFNNTYNYSFNDPVSVICFPKYPTSNIPALTEKPDKGYLDEVTFNTMSGSPVYFYSSASNHDSAALATNIPQFAGVFSRSETVRTNIVKSSYLLKHFMKLP